MKLVSWELKSNGNTQEFTEVDYEIPKNVQNHTPQ